MMIVVLDTNVIISALLKPGSVPGQVLQKVLDGLVQLALSDHMRNELSRALKYEHVRRLLVANVAELELDAFPERLQRICVPVEDTALRRTGYLRIPTTTS